jgi:hypothetical protein
VWLCCCRWQQEVIHLHSMGEDTSVLRFQL